MIDLKESGDDPTSLRCLLYAYGLLYIVRIASWPGLPSYRAVRNAPPYGVTQAGRIWDQKYISTIIRNDVRHYYYKLETGINPSVQVNPHTRLSSLAHGPTDHWQVLVPSVLHDSHWSHMTSDFGLEELKTTYKNNCSNRKLQIFWHWPYIRKSPDYSKTNIKEWWYKNHLLCAHAISPQAHRVYLACARVLYIYISTSSFVTGGSRSLS